MSSAQEQLNVRYWITPEGAEEAEERDFFTDFEEDAEQVDEINTFKVEGLENQHASVAQQFADALQERLGFASTSGLQYDKRSRPYVTIRRSPRGHSLEDALSHLEAVGL